jgi:hypothetical protein
VADGEQPAVGGDSVLDRCREGMLGSKPVIHAERPCLRRRRQQRHQMAVRGWRSELVGAAMQVHDDPPVGHAGGRHPFGRHSARVGRGDLRAGRRLRKGGSGRPALRYGHGIEVDTAQQFAYDLEFVAGDGNPLFPTPATWAACSDPPGQPANAQRDKCRRVLTRPAHTSARHISTLFIGEESPVSGPRADARGAGNVLDAGARAVAAESCGRRFEQPMSLTGTT